MLMRGRFTYKFLTCLLVCGLLLIINYYSSAPKNDEFLTHLSSVQSENKNATASKLQSLLNITNFEYLLTSELCKNYDKELLAILIITSYAGHDELRAAHRQAIPQSKLEDMGFQRVFLLAALPETEHFMHQNQLESEHKRFGDLVQGNFKEAYRNLSYKHVMGLRWASEECHKATYVIKIDDDIVFDVFQLRRYLESLELEHPKLIASDSLLAGYVLESVSAVRNSASKWYVSVKEYSNTEYPAYLSGWLYITNPSTAKRLVNAALQSPIFWIDDTWITGMIRKQLDIPLQNLNSWYSANSQFLECCLRDLKTYSYECDYFVGPNGGDSKLLVDFVHNVEKCYFDECTKRPPERSLKKTCVAEAKHIMPAHGEGLIEEFKLS